MTNPILGELQNLSPGAKAALAQAHQAATNPTAPPKLITDPSAQQLPPAISPSAHMSAPAAPPTTPTSIAPPASATPELPAAPTAAPIQAPKGTAAGDEQERARLLSTGSGIHQIQNPFLRGLAETGNVIGHLAAPGLMAAIPGTAEHHNSLIAQNAKQIGQDQQIQGADIGNQEKQAQTANLEAQPELNQAKLELGQQKQDATEQHQKETQATSLHEHGFKLDDTGQIVPLSYEEMSPQQQAVTDLKSSQEEVQKATADLKRAQKDNIPQQIQMAQQRIQTAQANARTAMGRLGLQQNEFKANYLGEAPGGEALPGAPIDETTGKPIGTRVANAGNASSDRIKRSDLANNVLENTKATRALIDSNPNLFGKAAGRFTSVNQMIGSDDPAISELGTRIHNIALASNGAHGVRSAEAIKETENQLLNHFRNSPEATKGALDAVDDSVKTFIEAAGHGKRPQPTSEVTGPTEEYTNQHTNPTTKQTIGVGKDGKWHDVKTGKVYQ